MPRLSLIFLPFILLFSATATQVQAWTFVWRNSTGANVAHENKPAKCVRIYHEKDLEFSWDPEGAWCLRIWRETECKNMIGWECEHTRWRKDASRNLSAYDVYRMPEDAREKFLTTTSEVSTTMKSETTGMTTTTGDSDARAIGTGAGETGANASSRTATPTGDADSADGGGSLSGGAIAGIVIGVVAGIVVLATGFFLWGRRRPRSRGEAGASIVSDTTPESTHSALHSGTHLSSVSGHPYASNGSSNGPQMTEAAALVASSDFATRYAPGAHVYHPPGPGLPVELPGEMGRVELSNSRQLMEMDGQGYVKRSSSITK